MSLVRKHSNPLSLHNDATQFTDSLKHVHTYPKCKNLQIHSIRNKTVRPDPKCPSQDELCLHVHLRYNCRQIQWRHLCPVYQTYTQHPLLPHLVHLSERIVVHTTIRTAVLHTAHKRSPRSKTPSTKDPLDLQTLKPTSTPSLTAYPRHPYLLSDDRHT